MKGLLLSLLCVIIFVNTQAQDTLTIPKRKIVKSLDIIAGYNYNKRHFAELGLGFSFDKISSPHPSAMGYYASCEANFSGKTLIAPKIGVWASGGMSAFAIGTQALYYTYPDFKEGSLTLRPEIGFGAYPVKVTYGYNVQLTNTSFADIGRHVFSVAVLLKVKQYQLK